MSVDALVLWAFVFAGVVVLALIVFVALPRAVREALRIVKRVLALVDESPLPLQVAKTEADVGRIGHALDQLPGLGRRAEHAAIVIRTTPLIPPAVEAVATRIGREIRAFRTASR